MPLLCAAASRPESDYGSAVEDTVSLERQVTTRSERREKITEEFKKVEIDISVKTTKTITIKEGRTTSHLLRCTC